MFDDLKRVEDELNGIDLAAEDADVLITRGLAERDVLIRNIAHAAACSPTREMQRKLEDSLAAGSVLAERLAQHRVSLSRELGRANRIAQIRL